MTSLLYSPLFENHHLNRKTNIKNILFKEVLTQMIERNNLLFPFLLLQINTWFYNNFFMGMCFYIISVIINITRMIYYILSIPLSLLYGQAPHYKVSYNFKTILFKIFYLTTPRLLPVLFLSLMSFSSLRSSLVHDLYRGKDEDVSCD